MPATVPDVPLNNSVGMPQLGFGVFQVGDDEARAAVATALDCGYRSIDTAALYGNEHGVGAAVSASEIPREELFITTKLWNADHGAGRVRPAFERSLDKLGLDYVDLYLIHWPVPSRDLFVETWQEFERLSAGTALARAKFDGLRRNAIFALGPARARRARALLERLTRTPAPW